MVDALVGDDWVRIEEVVLRARVGVSVVLREPTARDFNPDGVTGEETNTAGIRTEPKLVNLTRLHQLWFLKRLAESGAQHAVTQKAGTAVRM